MQAGVALGLAKTLAIRFPSWGPDFASLMVRTVLVLLFWDDLGQACCIASSMSVVELRLRTVQARQPLKGALSLCISSHDLDSTP